IPYVRICLLRIPSQPPSTLFPYTTLFRSRDTVILGTKTNVSWLRRVVTHPAFREGLVSTRFLADHEETLRQPMPDVIPLVAATRSEEHTSELQSLRHLVCRLLLEKKKKPT